MRKINKIMAAAVLVMASSLLARVEGLAQPFTVLRTNLQADLNAVAISPTGDVYIGGNTGTLARSTDQGNTWQSIVLPAQAQNDTITDIKIATDTIMVFSRHQLILTTNGFQSASVRPYPFRGIVRRTSAIDAYNIWACTSTEPSGVFTSNDAGLSWDSVAVHPSSIASFLDVKFATTQLGFAVGGNFKPGTRNVSVYRTLNGGLTWDSIQTFPRGLNGFNQQWAIYPKSASTWYCVGAKNMLSVTTDTGRTWTLLTQVDNSQPYIRCIAGAGDTLLAFGEEGYGRSGYYTRNGGQQLNDLPASWVAQAQFTLTGNQRRLVASAYRNRIGYAVAGRGTVIRLTAQSMGFVTSLPREMLQIAELKAWPNPVSASATVNLPTDLVGDATTARLLSTTGQEVLLPIHPLSASQVNVQLPAIAPGLYSLVVNGKQSRLVVQ